VPRIEFLESSAGRAKTIEAPSGGALVDLCDAHFAPIPFSCRSATCGTCHIHVLEGQELLEPPNEAEAELLSILRGPRGSRLACQAEVKSDPGVLRIRPADG
jgi:2Fe-2S ferredoxin